MSTTVAYDLIKKNNKITFGTVVVNRIDNAFDPIGSKVTKTDLHGLTLDKYLEGYCLGRDLFVSVNGKIVTESFDLYLVKQNDVITYVPAVRGGGGGAGKQILMIVAMIALTYIAGPAGTAAAAAMFGAGTTAALVAGYVFTAAIMVAGSLLINAVLGPGGSSALTSTTPELESNTYSWTGISTNRDLNKPIPVLYGTHALGGTVINSRFSYNGSDDWIGTQLALCHGEIQAITSDNIKVNDNDYSSYVKQGDKSNGWFQYSSGTFDQALMTGYSDSIYNNGAVSRKLDYNVPFVFTTESTNIDFFRLHFEFPSGLYNMDSQGSKSTSVVQVQAKYRKVGTSTWMNMYSYDPRGVLEYKYTYRLYTVDIFGNSVERMRGNSVERILWSSNPSLTSSSAPAGSYNFTKTGSYRYTKSAVFVPDINLTFRSASSVALKTFFEPVDIRGNAILLEDAQYEFSVTRVTPQPANEEDPYRQNKCHVRFLEEIQSADINYGGVALLGIDLKATDQLSNSRPNFKVTCTRKPLKINNILRDSTNPAWICLDILTNKHYGMGLGISEVDLTVFNRWAAFCDGGIANTFTLSKTIPSLVNGTNIIAGDLVIPVTDLPEGESLSLKRLVRESSTCLGTGTTYVKGTLTDIVLRDENINKVTLKYISAHGVLADGYYYIVSFSSDLKANSALTYDLVFKDTAYAATPKLTFNGLFDTSSDIWTALQDVAQVGRGQVILRGNKYSCIYDDIKTVKGLFNAANSKNVTVQYLSSADIASEIEIQYSDANIEYEMNSISIQDADAMASGVTTNKTTKQIKGITTENEALIMGKYLLASSKFLRRVVTLDADIESITQTVGDLIAVQTDVTQYGIGGLVDKKVGNAVFLDNIVQLEKGKTYTLKIKNHLTDDIKDYTFLAQDSDPTLFTFDAQGVATVGSLKFDDFTLGISFESELYLETNMIVLSEGYEILIEDRYSFGITGSDSILCTILEISRDGDLSRNIIAVEYNASILDFNYDNDMVQRLEATGKPLNTISNLVASDRLVKLENSQVVAMVSFAWDTKISSYYNIYLLEEGGYKNYLGNNIRENRYEYPNTQMTPEVPYTIYIEDTNDMSIIDTLVYTITSFSAVPEDITAVSLTTFGANIDFNINYSNKPLDFAYYNLYRNSTLISTQISDTFSIRHVIGTNGVTYGIEAVDMIKKKSNRLNQMFTTVPPSISAVDYTTEGEDIKLKVVLNTPSTSSFDIDYYTIRYNGTTVSSKETTIYMRADFTGERVYRVTATDVLGNTSSEFSVAIAIAVPVPLNTVVVIEGKEAVISWAIPSSSVPIDYYELSYDTKVVKSKSNNYRLPVYWLGLKVFSIATVNVLGARSAEVEVSLEITPGTITQLQTEVIDNNVLLKWTPAQGSLPIENFILYKGLTLESLVEVGEKKGTFTTVFESNAGQYTYWLGAVDSAGNLGELKSATTLVSEPPDYILNVNWVSTFSGTRVNALVEEDYLVLPVNTTETIAQHFTNNSWTTPQAQVDSGNALWIQPFLSTASYTEVFDYGTSLASSLVTLEYTIENIIGSASVVPTLSISQDNVTYTDYIGQTQVYGTGFRYVKVHIEVSGTNQGSKLKGLSVKLDSKIKNDSGSGLAVAGDLGGTVVTFNKDFVDITSISVTPIGTTPRFAIYDFVDAPNPTEFKVLMYDTSGTRINGQFSWSARGY